jgi:hypothetical protein
MRAWLDRLDLRTSVSLPPLLSFWTARPRRRSGGRWAVGVALAAAVAGCGWWGYSNPDSVTLASEAVRSGVAAVYDRVASQTWRQHLTLGSQPEPEIRPPDSPPDTPAAAAQPDAATSRATVAAGSSAVPQPEVRSPTPPGATPSHTPAAAAASAAVRDSTPAVAADSAATPPAGSEAAPGAPTGQNGSAARARIELAADNVEVPPDEPMAHVVVRRSRAMHGDISFNWWTESGTAKPGRDFVPVNTQVEHIENGQSAISLIIPVVVDPARRESRNFYVVIDQPSDNATIGPRTLTMVTLPGSEPETGETPDR